MENWNLSCGNCNFWTFMSSSITTFSRVWCIISYRGWLPNQWCLNLTLRLSKNLYKYMYKFHFTTHYFSKTFKLSENIHLQIFFFINIHYQAFRNSYTCIKLFFIYRHSVSPVLCKVSKAEQWLHCGFTCAIIFHTSF